MSVMNSGRTISECQRILLVEDEPDLARLICLNLGSLQHEVTQINSLNQARHLLHSKRFDLLLLDRMLGDGDGLTLCQQLRQEGMNLPCMIITARDSESDIVLGLESGADDYLVKPFSVLELRARVKALLRRTIQSASDQYSLTFDKLVIDSKTREVTAANQPLALTAREFDLLYYLAQHPRQVFSRMQLLEAVWGYSYAGYEHTVNSHINRLRAKLACCPSSNELVQTVWGVGYKFAPPAAH